MIRIITDSVTGIPQKLAEDNQIEVVSLYVNYQGEEFMDATMDVDAFYEDIYDMIDDIPKSSQPSQAEFLRIFTEAAEAGDEVLGIFISAKFSGTINGALYAARAVAANHAGFRYCMVDACANSFEEAFPVFQAVAARDAGCTLEQCVEQVVHSVKCSRIMFVPESLRFLKAGGRIGSAAALVGSVIKLLPIITVTDGEVRVLSKVRTYKKALTAMLEQLKSDIQEHGLANIVVQYIGNPEEAKEWARDVVSPLCDRLVPVIPVSPVIGLHVGPALGVSYECDEPLEGKLSPGYAVPVHWS